VTCYVARHEHGDLHEKFHVKRCQFDPVMYPQKQSNANIKLSGALFSMEMLFCL
jgi:hypothetical protein